MTLVAGIACLLGHMIWISLDCHRRGRAVGAWRYFAVLAAPVALPLYLLIAYRLRGILWLFAYVLFLASASLVAVAGAYGVWLLQNR